MCWLCLSLWGFDGPNRTLCAGFAAEPIGRRVPVGVLVFAIMILDDLVIAFTYAGIEGAANAGNPWSHGLCISGIWSGATALLAAGINRDNRAGAAVGLLVLSHWVLELISHPIPFFQLLLAFVAVELRTSPATRSLCSFR